MKTFLSFTTGMLIGAIAYAAAEQYCMRVDRNYAFRQLMLAGIDPAELFKSKKEET